MADNESESGKQKQTPIERISNGVIYLVFCAVVFMFWQIIGGIVGSTYSGLGAYSIVSVIFLIVWIVGSIVIAIKVSHGKLSEF